MAVRDILVISVIIFTVAIAFFVIAFAVNTGIDALVSIPQVSESQNAVDAFQGVQNNVTNRLDYVIFVLFIGLTLAIIITGWFIGGIAIFMAIYIIILILSVVFASVFAYAWQQITPAAVFGTAVSNFPITNHLLNWLPLYIAVVGTIGLIVMFAKPYFMGEQ